jgi:hypothetical protein
MRNDLGAAPLRLKGAFRQVRRTDVRLMTLGNVEVVEAGLGVVP